MNKHLQFFILFIFFSLSQQLLFSQIPDSLSHINATDSTKVLTNDSLFRGISADSLSSMQLDTIKLISKEDTVAFLKVLDLKFFPDTLYLKNGDKITGKIISFEQGRLKIDAQGPGVVSVKWSKILTINGGNRHYKIEDIYGMIYIGRIKISDVAGHFKLINEEEHDVLLENIVRIFPLEDKWYKGIKGTMGAGFNYAKSSDVLTMNAEYNLYYVVSKWRFKNDFSYISTKSEDEIPSVRINVNLQELYSLPNKWVLSEANSFTRNDELGVKSRISFGAGGGNNLIQSEWQRLLILTGITLNLERDIETKKVINNLEWPVTLQHAIYRFANPDLSSYTSITYFQGLTEAGRFRIDASTDLTWEFIPNFELQLTFYYNFDNKEIEGKNSERDYGTVLSLLLDLK